MVRIRIGPSYCSIEIKFYVIYQDMFMAWFYILISINKYRDTWKKKKNVKTNNYRVHIF